MPLLFLILFFSFSCAHSMGRPAPKKGFELHGHRGARARYPENSWPAFQYALDLGVDALELDLVLAKENRVILSHDLSPDPTLCRYKNGDGLTEKKNFIDMDLAEIRSIECGAEGHPDFPEQKALPGLHPMGFDEFLVRFTRWAAASKKQVHLNIESKMPYKEGDPQVDPVRFTREIEALLRRYGVVKQVIFQSFDTRTLQAMKELNPDVKLSWLVAQSKDLQVERAVELGVNYVSPRWNLVARNKKIQLFQEHGFKVLPWTVNSKSGFWLMIRRGADGLITDDPQKFFSYIRDEQL